MWNNQLSKELIEKKKEWNEKIYCFDQINMWNLQWVCLIWQHVSFLFIFLFSSLLGIEWVLINLKLD